MSEFSVAWGKRGEGGQGREGVQLPDSLMDKAVLQSAGPRCPGGRGERHQRSSQLLSLSVEGTCGRTRCRRHTTQ